MVSHFWLHTSSQTEWKSEKEETQKREKYLVRWISGGKTNEFLTVCCAHNAYFKILNVILTVFTPFLSVLNFSE